MESPAARANMSPHSQSGKETTTLTPNPDVAKPLELTAAGCLSTAPSHGCAGNR